METTNAPTRVRLGDVEVARVGLGTNRLTDTPDQIGFVRAAIAAGLNHIDTAFTYTGGESERTIAAALSPKPDHVIVATKGGYAAGTGRPDVLSSQLEESLRRLRTDAIDLYYLHRVDPQTPLEESVAFLRQARDAGKIRHVGLSQVGIEQIETARAIVPIAAVQNHYNLTERRWDDVVDHCEREGIVFVPYFPLKDDAGREVDRIAAGRDATPSQIRLAWLLRRSTATLPIPGTLSIDHLNENLAALELDLTRDEFEALS